MFPYANPDDYARRLAPLAEEDGMETTAERTFTLSEVLAIVGEIDREYTQRMLSSADPESGAKDYQKFCGATEFAFRLLQRLRQA